MASKKRSSPVRYDQVLRELERAEADAQLNTRGRTRLLSRLEKEGEPQPRRAIMYFSRLDRDLTHGDIIPFTSMLKKIGKTPNLDFIIHSPGGDGTAAEKMLDMCRKYCTGKMRVVVPLYAKSAATRS